MHLIDSPGTHIKDLSRNVGISCLLESGQENLYNNNLCKIWNLKRSFAPYYCIRIILLVVAIIIHSCIANKLDDFNSLLYGLCDFQIQRLQKYQMTAVHILTKYKIDSHTAQTFTLASYSLQHSIQNYCSKFHHLSMWAHQEGWCFYIYS